MYRVLIADDDEMSRGPLARALATGTCRVEVVSCGVDALVRIARAGADVLIAEVHLPDIPAWKLFPAVRRIDPDTMLIAVTADESYETSIRVRTEGGPVFFYGLKPLNLQEMQQVVSSAIRWRQERRVKSTSGVV